MIDTKPHHEFATEQYNMLIQFAELCVREIEKDKASARRPLGWQPRCCCCAAVAAACAAPPEAPCPPAWPLS